MARKGYRLCPYCLTEQSASHFYPAYGTQYDEYVPLCIDCCEAKLNKYAEMVGEPAALYTILGEIGVPLIRSVYQEVIDSRNRGGPKPKVVGAYIKRLQRCGTIYNGFWDTDMDINELLKHEAREQKNSVMDLKLMKQIWGKYPDDEYVEAYQFLEQAFDEYTEDLMEMDANLTNRYRDLCKAEYQKRKAYELGDTQEIAKAQNNVQALLKLLKLDNFEEKSKSDSQIAYEKAIAMIEYTKPAECEDLTKYIDMCQHEKDHDETMRCLQNAIAGTRDYPSVPRSEK